ncbi:MAG: extracellular solute-binding protein [Pseudomonadota bacterium]
MKPLHFLLLPVLALAGCGAPEQAADAPEDTTVSETLTIYSARHYDSDQLLYDQFEADTGISIDVREQSADQLLETMRAEGDQSPADLVIASDAGALWRFKDAGLTQAVSAPTLEAAIPESYRDPAGHWFALARRVRLVAYDAEQVDADAVNSWQALSDPALEGEICVRTSSNIYNLSLMAEIIERLGPDAAQSWAEGVSANFARQPQGGDTDQIRAVAAGECSVAIVNHYYWARLAASESESDAAVAEKTTLIVPSFGDGGGAHVNVTGAAITATADNVDTATAFIEFLLTDGGQALLTRETKELPLFDGETPSEGAQAIPAFEASNTPLTKFGENQAEAQRLYDLAGWN